MDALGTPVSKAVLIMNFSDKDELDALAGEYVLSVLSLEDRKAVEQEMLRNRELITAVAFWQDRFLEIVPPPNPIEPSPDLWKRIEKTLSAAPNVQQRTTQATQHQSIWNNLFFWRASGFAGLAAAVLLSVRMLTMSPINTEPQYLALLQSPNNGSPWLVEVDEKAVHLRPLKPIAATAGKSFQFWTKPEGATGPTSLGLVSADRPTTIPLTRLPSVGQNQLFEVTLEPEAGSPINRPTGPVLAVGKIVRI